MSVEGKDLALSEEELARQRHNERMSRNLLGDALQRSFLSPKRAFNRIQNHRAANGDESAFKKLRDPKHVWFGRRPGSILSRGGLRKGARNKRRHANLSRRNLPELIKGYERDRARRDAAEKSHKEALRRYGPTPHSPGSPGPKQSQSFMEKLRAMRAKKQAKPDLAKGAERNRFSLRDLLARRARPPDGRGGLTPRRRGRDGR